MKLLMVSGDRSILQRKRGAFWYTLQELREYFDRIDVITPRSIILPTSGTLKSKAGESSLIGGRVFFHPCQKRLTHQPWWIKKKGKELIEMFGHEVMTVHEYPPFYNGIGARRLARRMKIPYALEVHHIVGYPHAASLSELIARRMSHSYFKRASRRADAVRVVNRQVFDQLNKWGVEADKMQIIPSFYLDKDVLTTRKAPPVIYDVAFCGRLVPNKGLPQLIKAISKFENARLVVIGDGPARDKYEKFANSLGLQDRVFFVGWLPTLEAVIEAMLSASMFVLPSKSEGGPRVLVEAMAAGMPVISTKIGIAPEVIKDGENGLFTTGMPDDLAEKIRILRGDEGLRKRFSAEAPKILERFERRKLVKEYAEFLQNLVR